MSTGIYGGDEVGAIVLDIGSHSVRGGFAGEDMPKADFKTTVGIIADFEAMSGSKKFAKCFIDTVNTKVPRESMEMVNFLEDGMIEDWNIFEQVFEYFYDSYIKSTPDQHPLLMSEPPWNSKDKREKLEELLFEKYNIPAFYLCKNAVLSAFSHGRSTALVIDSGATHTSAVPVYDGYVIQQAVTRTNLGGNFIIEECKKFMEQQNIEIIPQYLIASKDVIPESAKPLYKLKEKKMIHSTFHEASIKDVLEDFSQTVLQISDNNYEEEMESLENMQPVFYEFPNGYNKKFGLERFRIGESLFDTTFIRSCNSASVQSVSQVITSAVAKCDIDIRPSLYNGVIVVGGNSLLNGFSDRLNIDLANKLPATMKLKVNASQVNIERRFSSWIGGSILASLGSFQQLWISKQEFEEVGKSCIEMRCA